MTQWEQFHIVIAIFVCAYTSLTFKGAQSATSYPYSLVRTTSSGKKNASKSLEALDIQLSSSTTGNLVANIFGYQDWNIVKAKTEITVEISANLDILENVTDLSIPIYSFPGKKDLSTEIIGYTKIDNISSLRVKAIEFSDFTDDNNGYYSYVDPVKPISKDGLMKVFYVSASLASGGKEHNEDDDFVVVCELPLRKRSGLPRNSQLLSGY